MDEGGAGSTLRPLFFPSAFLPLPNHLFLPGSSDSSLSADFDFFFSFFLFSRGLACLLSLFVCLRFFFIMMHASNTKQSVPPPAAPPTKAQLMPSALGALGGGAGSCGDSCAGTKAIAVGV